MNPLWSPSENFTNSSNMKHFMDWVNKEFGVNFSSYKELHAWSITEQDSFWGGLFKYYNILHDKPNDIDTTIKLSPDQGMIGTQWFPKHKVNYAEHVFRNSNTTHPALQFANEQGHRKTISWKELKEETHRLAEHYKNLGLGKGSKIVAFLPNIPEAITAFLACNSIGAIWSSCSPDFGTASVIDRFSQISPDLLLVANGYWYNNKVFDKTDANNELTSALKSIKQVITIQYCSDCDSYTNDKSIQWTDIPIPTGSLQFERVEFNEPIWVLYSSGTTGLPKAITHSVGGILLEHYKALALHQNTKAGEVFFWFSTTGWMMWNYANAALLTGTTVAIYDGSPAYPNLNVLWDYAEEVKVNHFGAGASFFITCMKKGLKLNKPLSNLISIGSTGSPLTPEAFEWIYNDIKKDLWLISLSGGTDICSGFIGGNPFDDVVIGEIQCRMLGVDLHAYSESNKQVIDELGEMVINSPLPSMPIYFWNDVENKKYHSSYFEMYPNKWRHGDWIRISDRGSVVIHGRSDSTLNRGGVRIGTSEIYNAVESLSVIQDSIVICTDNDPENQQMLLFVVLKPNNAINSELLKSLKKQLITMYSPRHVPDAVYQIEQVPYTASGKKMEAAVKKIISGKSIIGSVSKDSMKNPESLDYFENFNK